MKINLSGNAKYQIGVKIILKDQEVFGEIIGVKYSDYIPEYRIEWEDGMLGSYPEFFIDDNCSLQ